MHIIRGPATHQLQVPEAGLHRPIADEPERRVKGADRRGRRLRAQHGYVGGVVVLYLLLWGTFLVGSMVLGVLLIVAAARLLAGWRPPPPGDVARAALAVLVGASAFGFAYGALMWFGFPDGDASRGITAAPPLVFGALAATAAAGYAIVRRVARSAEQVTSEIEGAAHGQRPPMSERSR